MRRASSADVGELAATPLLETDVPALVALETLPGANHFEFAAGEEPPWRWLVRVGADDAHQWASWCSMTPNAALELDARRAGCR